MTFLVGLLNLICLLAWGCLMLFLYAVGGGRSWDPATLFLYCGPLAYFFLCFVSTLPVVTPARMLPVGILANVALLPFLGMGLAHGGEGLLFALPFLALTALWYVAWRRKSAASLAPRAAGGNPPPP
jgi:hypothetical protein